MEDINTKLVELFDHMDRRIAICETLNKAQRIARLSTTLDEMQAILKCLQELEESMAAFKNAAEVDNADDMLQEARAECDKFIKMLLEEKMPALEDGAQPTGDTILGALIKALDLDGALGFSSAAWIAGLGSKVTEVLAAAAKAQLPDFKASNRILTLFQVLLPELMTPAGKGKLDPKAIKLAKGHDKYRDGIINGVFKEVSK